MRNLAAVLPLLLPKAIAWAESEERRVQRDGRALSPDELVIAVDVGVRDPQRVRVLLVEELPQPEDPVLREAGREAGLLGPTMIGRTFGHAVSIRRGHLSRRTLSHELRHVGQYEESGGIASFLPVYLAKVLEYGYASAPFEVDARRHETE